MIYTENVNVLQLNQHLGGKNLPIKNDKILRIYIYIHVCYLRIFIENEIFLL